MGRTALVRHAGWSLSTRALLAPVALARLGRPWPRTAGLLASVLASVLTLPAGAVELDRLRVALLIDAMATRGAGYDPTELNALGVDGLAAVLDYFLPQTAPAPVQAAPADPPAHEVLRRLEALDAEDFATREAATAWLIAHARPQRALVAAWSESDVLERRLRVQRVLASWEVRPAARLSTYTLRDCGPIWNRSPTRRGWSSWPGERDWPWSKACRKVISSICCGCAWRAWHTPNTRPPATGSALW
jgi:hypothetical protein